MSDIDEGLLAMSFIFGSMFLIMGAVTIDAFWYDEIETFTDTPLHNLQDESQINGRFSLGSGYIDEQPCFVFYEVEGNGYVLKSAPAYNSKIIEDEDESPYIRRYESYEKGRIIGLKDDYRWRNEFHVPKGTVIKEWYLDAKL